MKYAVEARIFNSGKIITRVRPASDREEEGCYETTNCDIWIDIFDNPIAAERFALGYKNA